MGSHTTRYEGAIGVNTQKAGRAGPRAERSALRICHHFYLYRCSWSINERRTARSVVRTFGSQFAILHAAAASAPLRVAKAHVKLNSRLCSRQHECTLLSIAPSSDALPTVLDTICYANWFERTSALTYSSHDDAISLSAARRLGSSSACLTCCRSVCPAGASWPRGARVQRPVDPCSRCDREQTLCIDAHVRAAS